MIPIKSVGFSKLNRMHATCQWALHVHMHLFRLKMLDFQGPVTL